MTSLYNKYRPTSLEDVVGQSQAVAMLKKFVQKKKVPHTILFSGDSGCGKTTLARIMATHVGCNDLDLIEINSASFRGIDTVREIKQQCRMAPISGKSRVWIIDECHQLTKDAQNAFLKLLEEPPSHSYFFLATTEPKKLLKTIQTRCTSVKVRSLTVAEIDGLVRAVCKAEREEHGNPLEMEDEVYSRIANLADGSARQALVMLEAVIDLDSTEQQIDSLNRAEFDEDVISLARELFDFRASYRTVAAKLQKVKEEPETIRRTVIGYAAAILGNPSGKNHARAFEVITVMRGHYYDSGKAGLVADLYELMSGKK